MKNVARVGKFLLDLVEIYIPVVTFVVMFLAFVLQIVTRYFFNYPLAWPFELSSLAFVWTILLGACYAVRKKDMVEFGVLYELFSEKSRLWLTLFGHLIVVSSFLIALYPIYDYIQFLARQRTTVLRIPFNYAYFPFVVMILVMIGHSINDAAVTIRRLAQIQGSQWKHSHGIKKEEGI